MFLEIVSTFFISLGLQLASLLGVFLLFGFLLSHIQAFTHRMYVRSVGWKGILWTAWMGTPIHELGHVFFAKIFRHTINEVYLFRPNPATGNLGHVDHSYRTHSWYQRIGNFFIGAAPLICGSAVLVAMLYFLLPNGREVFAPLVRELAGGRDFFSSLGESLANLFSGENIRTWNFWVFLYVSFCVASHMAPSRADQSGMWRGLFWIVALLLILNLVAVAARADITGYVLALSRSLKFLIGIFAYALLISILHFIMAAIVLSPWRRRL